MSICFAHKVIMKPSHPSPSYGQCINNFTSCHLHATSVNGAKVARINQTNQQNKTTNQQITAERMTGSCLLTCFEVPMSTSKGCKNLFCVCSNAIGCSLLKTAELSFLISIANMCCYIVNPNAVWRGPNNDWCRGLIAHSSFGQDGVPTKQFFWCSLAKNDEVCQSNTEWWGVHWCVIVSPNMVVVVVCICTVFLLKQPWNIFCLQSGNKKLQHQSTK